MTDDEIPFDGEPTALPPLPPPPEEEPEMVWPDSDPAPPHDPGPPPSRTPERAPAGQTVDRLLGRTLGSHAGRPAHTLLQRCGDVETTDDLLDTLEPGRRRQWLRFIAACRHTWASAPDATVDFDHDAFTSRLAGDPPDTLSGGDDPDVTFQQLLDAVADHRFDRAYRNLQSAVADGGEQARIDEAVAALTTARAVGGDGGPERVYTRASDIEPTVAEGETGRLRLSSGLRTFDVALTNFAEDQPLGFIKDGELATFFAESSGGKSAFARPLVRSMVVDMVERWGLTNAVIILAFTEEDKEDILNVMEMLPGQRFDKYRDNLVLLPVNGRLDLLHAGLCQVIADQVELADRLNVPIDQTRPRGLVVDYIGGVAEGMDNAWTDGLAQVAHYCMRGACELAIDNLEDFGRPKGGKVVSYQSITGRPWDDRLRSDNVKMPVVVFSQINQVGNNTPGYGEKDADSHEYFRTIDGKPVHEPVVGDDGVLRMRRWIPQKGDRALLPRTAMMGSTVLINHSTTIVQLHRSQPLAGTRQVEDEDGELHTRAADPQARLWLEKTRYDSRLPSKTVPLQFDSNLAGNRGAWHDVIAIAMWNMGVFEPLNAGGWQPGDPLIPKKQQEDVFDVAY